MINKKLLVARHAEAVRDYDDFNRNLSVKGYQQAIFVGKQLHHQGFTIDEIWASESVRTLTTAELIAQQVHFDANKINYSKELYNASVRVWLQYIRQNFQPSSNCILIVGHNPHISYLIELLTGESFGGLSPAQTAILESSSDWEDWGEKTAILKGFISEQEEN
jgi:phosphohistidine phosphatase